MPAPQAVLDLVERFERNRDAYKSPSYNETQLRREFLDPFFEALGWDVNNRQGYAEAYKDVIHEDAIKVGGATKAPDYSFRIGGTRKFFVEAKKPAVNIKEDIAPAFQLRRYAWSAKLPLSILTDFEEFAVYDCRVKPDKADKTATARTVYFTYRQYAEKWDEIAAVFSRDAVLKGSFDKYAESHKAKKGTAEVDDAFLAEIEKWRDLLARNIALRNPALTTRELNFSVQRTIDRLIFLRICEDRGIEDYGTLRLMVNGVNVYPRLRELYYKADARYNSGLFHFRQEKDVAEAPDNLTLSLNIDDKPLKDILRNLYYPDSPYEFAVLPADILGQVYEQFLGRVIRLTAGHHAVVEDKPEVKKAGGVFYTPTYIVEYIVRNTVEQLLGDISPGRSAFRRDQPKPIAAKAAPTNVTPKEASKLRILDPACGSGSFLLGAYQYLLDWHLRWYIENDPTKWAKTKQPALYQGYGGAWRLTTAERKRILLNNIYGVDIDSQAVEVTKLSLLLKVLEGETGESINKQLSFFHERALPDLSSNIKCGNSLIGPDFYDGKQLSFLDEEERYRVNVFDWEREFPEVFKAGGFDAVIGNPPYGATLTQEGVNYLQSRYKLQDYALDTYLLFLEKSFLLLKKSGLFGMIIPNTWLLNLQSVKIRRHIFNNIKVLTIVHYLRRVFVTATVDTEVVILQNTLPGKDDSVGITITDKNGNSDSYLISQSRWQKDGKPVNIFERPEFVDIADKLKAFPVLDNLYVVTQGAKPFQVGKGKPPQTREIVDKKPFVAEERKDATFRPLLRGSLVNKYKMVWDNNYWISFGDWLAEPRYSANYDATAKIVVRQTGDSLIATLDRDQFVVRDNLYTIVSRKESDDLHYLLGLLNSRLLTWYYQSVLNPEKGEALAQVKRGHLAQLPIALKDIAKHSDKAQLDRMVQLVEQMLTLNKQLAAARTGHDTTFIQRQIDATDRQIDRLVYELYGLTEEEIAVVEGK